MVHHAEDSITSSLHVVVWTNATEHRRQPESGPGFMTQLPGKRNKQVKRFISDFEGRANSLRANIQAVKPVEGCI